VITEDEYVALALPELHKLLDALDRLENEQVEAELESDILTIELGDGSKYVINSHRAARQIWMAAERSAWHFDWNAEKRAWIATKSGDELWSTLEGVLGRKLGQAISLR
jgi:CyaY protein